MKIDKNKFNEMMNPEGVALTQNSIPDSCNSLPSGAISDPYNFAANVKAFLRKRLRFVNNKLTGDCLFILIPNEIKRDVEHLGQGVDRFFSSMSIGIKGKVILSLDVRLSKVRILDVGCDSSTDEIAMHNIFSAEIEKILSLNPVNISYCRYAHDCSMLSAFPDAKNADADADIYDLNAKQITYNCAELEKHTDDFYQKELKYPSSTMMIWDKQTEFKLIAKAETRISARLGDSLQNKLGKENVATEPNVNSGRIDIFIHSNAMGVDQGPCIIELKVLRHEKSDNYNRRWLYKGVLQARDYALDMDAKSKYLFSFDGREKNSEFAVIPLVAGKYDVKYINYRMYNKTDQARDEEIENQAV
ncbi:hypothetical protein L1C56_19415 [Klebsiella pneumoniae]|uniref:hypothetical protein n=1 Tax=Klebsiella pneumoniae complex TaxID=3390273 RepID=UPI001CC30FCB|nr:MULTISPECIES: hypothetical protein [Klebsiella]MCQ0849657.1 hypothetical protein [Klebsiella pneumoniae]MDE4750309.1 hypothetical protein [Klebsiella pneumoniae]MDP1481379.1 hypothetical protein [Klebsiella pneumoniae]